MTRGELKLTASHQVITMEGAASQEAQCKQYTYIQHGLQTQLIKDGIMQNDALFATGLSEAFC